jgi:hypothetical protein
VVEAGFEEGEPEQAIVPMKSHEHTEDGIEREVVAFQMHELVLEDELTTLVVEWKLHL